MSTTSTWLYDRAAPEALHDIVDGYAEVVDNLNAHAHLTNPRPTPQHVRTLIKPGTLVYGIDAVGNDVLLSEGAELLPRALRKEDARPLWVLVWGGTNVLAAVIYRTLDDADAAILRSKLRIYTISDQDDTGAWMRQQ